MKNRPYVIIASTGLALLSGCLPQPASLQWYAESGEVSKEVPVSCIEDAIINHQAVTKLSHESHIRNMPDASFREEDFIYTTDNSDNDKKLSVTYHHKGKTSFHHSVGDKAQPPAIAKENILREKVVMRSVEEAIGSSCSIKGITSLIKPYF